MRHIEKNVMSENIFFLKYIWRFASGFRFLKHHC